MSNLLKDSIFIILGITSATFGLKGFLIPNHFIDGGAMGISMLASQFSGISLGIFIILLNTPFIFLGKRLLGNAFALKTFLAIVGLSISLSIISIPLVTTDPILIAVFGGVFLGAGIGFAMRGGAVIDGTEVLAIYLSKKLGATVGDIMLAINVLIFSLAAYLMGAEIALYSLLTYLAASKALDFIVEGIEEYVGVTIVSDYCEEVRLVIIEKLNRGVTVYSGKKGYGKRGDTENVDVLYSVITRLEINRMYTEVEKIDPNAFIVMHSVKDTKGGMIKKRSLKA
ncbi:MAG: hypothetical protein RLZZ198_700 [Bacteroidota bacterium]|jgi:uncharacterized membrane-anchored protein YitT (DUF2179 family)